MTEPAETVPPVRVGSVDDLRRRNLGALLRLVHERGPMTRSELTRATGLNRSTIGDLVGELATLGLAITGDAVPGRGVGRPSPVVRAAADVVAITVVPEVDAVSFAVVGLDGAVRDVDAVPVERPSPEVAADIVVDRVRRMLAADPGRRVVGIGVSVPGTVRVEDGVVRDAPHLGWKDVPFARPLAERTGLPVVAANDATLGATAEFRFGAGRGETDLVYVNGGASGIGGGIIAGSRSLTGTAGYAGELGHVFVADNGVRCHCGAFGCLETVVSRRALLTAAGIEHGAGPELLDELRTALEAPSPELAAEVDRQLGALAIGLRGVAHTLAPGVVVLGGFLAVLLDHAGDDLRGRVLAQTMPAIGEGLRIESSELGPTVLFRGAAELAFAELLADPR